MSEVPDELVRTGFWINQSYGSILGATITTDLRTAVVLIALLAFLVSVAATHLWNICLFIYHQLRPPARDGLYHQQQALLRTLPGPDTVAVDLIRISWLWRGNARRSLQRCLLPSSLAVLFLGAAVIAGVFTSFAVNTTDIEVLVNSKNCGYPPIPDPTSFESQLQAEIYVADVASEYTNYATNCYSANSANSLPSLCRSFIQPRLPLQIHHVDCPFNSSMCLSSSGRSGSGRSKESIKLDTGYLDSLKDLGINVKKEDRIKYRLRNVCTPVKVEGQYTLKHLPQNFDLQTWHEPLPGELAYYFYYGSNPLAVLHKHFYADASNFTLLKSTFQLNYTYNYDVIHLDSSPPNRLRNGGFKAIPSLQVQNADTQLYFIFAGNINYKTKIEDPVFAAHQKQNLPPPLNTVDWYTSDYPAGVIGCTQQTQFCIPTGGDTFDDCTEFLGFNQVLTEINDRQGTWSRMNSVQNATAFWIWYTQLSSDQPGLMLEASKYLVGGQSTIPLPDNQWEIESKLLVGYTLAKLQVLLATIAHGPSHEAAKKLTTEPSSTAEEYLCQSFKMKKPGGFGNINVFALVFTVVTSLILTLMDGIILKFVIYLSKVREHLAPRVDEWIQGGVLQLQRRVHEIENPEAVWLRLDKEIPVMVSGQSDPLPIYSPGPGSEEQFPNCVSTGSLEDGTDSTTKASLANDSSHDEKRNDSTCSSCE